MSVIEQFLKSIKLTKDEIKLMSLIELDQVISSFNLFTKFENLSFEEKNEKIEEHNEQINEIRFFCDEYQIKLEKNKEITKLSKMMSTVDIDNFNDTDKRYIKRLCKYMRHTKEEIEIMPLSKLITKLENRRDEYYKYGCCVSDIYTITKHIKYLNKEYYTNKQEIEQLTKENLQKKQEIELLTKEKIENSPYGLALKELIMSDDFCSGKFSEYFYHKYLDKFVYNHEKLYIYTGVYWKEESKSYLHNFIDRDIYIELTKNSTEQITKLSESHSKETNEKRIQIHTSFLKKLQKLRKITFRRDCVADILNKITNNDIIWNSSPFLFAFNNKIFDIKNNKFIQPYFNQYINLTTGYDYNDNQENKEENKKELDTLLIQIFPNENVRDYYLMALCSGLYGQQQEYIYICNGAGGNGKSLLNSLALNMLGEYAYKLPSQVLLSEIKADGANPQLANMNNKRFILCQEPSSKRRINSSTLKEITGDKTINSRGLYSSNCTVNLKNTLFMECNELPLIDEVNDAINRRIRVIPFISKFVTKDVYDLLEDKDNVFLANPKYKSDSFQIDFRQTLFNLLCKYFQKFQKDDYKIDIIPDDCKQKQSDYLACSDDIYEWFTTIYEKVNNVEEQKELKGLLISDVYQKFILSTLYNNLSKTDKRKYTNKYFSEKIQTNLFLKNFIKARDTRYNNIKYKSPYLINFRLIEKSNDDDDEIINI